MKPEIKTIQSLGAADRHAMLALLRRHFDGVTERGFADDLDGKTLAVLLRDQQGVLRGFSTLAVYPGTGPEGEPVTVACSGDTIVAPEAWGSSALPRAWINAAMRWHETHGRGRLYWLLITSGFRTYRFLPVFFRRFYPHARRPTPAAIAAWIDRLAEDRWGSAYDRASGLVRFADPQRLRGRLAEIPAERLRDAHVGRFLSLNPGHAEGDELVCLCSLHRDNLTRAGARMLQAGHGVPGTPAADAAP